MADMLKSIGYAMSLRSPQLEALTYLDAISSKCDYKTQNKAEIERIASANCEHHHTIKVNNNFDFPSFCFDMATGIGKTRLMGASIYYLYKTKGYKHFFILTPGNTIYDKLRKEANPAHPKYIFKGLEAEMGRPKVYDGENYDSYTVRSKQSSLPFEKDSDIEIFIFNIGKIFNSRTDSQFNFHKFKETLGMSFADILAHFDDLVICMDEAHRYYAPASMKAINFLRPILGLEFTATPKTDKNIIYRYDVAKGAAEGYLKTPVVAGRSNMSGYSDEDIEDMKILDGLKLHEIRKGYLKQYCNENNLPYVKPIVLIACKDTEHAKKITDKIDSDDFQNGKYKGKVIAVHSKLTGEETEENIKKLLSVEDAHNPVEIVLHVYKLKEGWDVNNLFTIIPLNAAKSEILAMQTIGRGLRLPFGQITGKEELDTLDIVAHEHYHALVEEIKNDKLFKYRNLDDEKDDMIETVQVETVVNDDELSLFDQAILDTGVRTFIDIETNTQTQEDLYNSYLRTFGVSTQNQNINNGMTSLFGDETNQTLEDSGTQSSIIPTSDNEKQQTQKKRLSKEEFIDKIKSYSGKAISVPKILVQTSSKITFNHFDVKKTIQDFEIEMGKIERFDAINQVLLQEVDAEMLETVDAKNTLACMLFDSVSEFSYDNIDYIIAIVEQYLQQIDGTEEDINRIVRRYGALIIRDIQKQIYEHTTTETKDLYTVQRDLIIFRSSIKNVKENGKVKFDKQFTDKSNIKKYLFTGYKKAYYTENTFDSYPELVFSRILEEDSNVIRWIKPPLNQMGIFWKAGSQYNPDFLVETSEKKYMVEVKASNKMNDEEVLGKAKEGIKWCKYASTNDPDGKMWQYCLISEDNIEAGNTCKFTLGLAKVME